MVRLLVAALASMLLLPAAARADPPTCTGGTFAVLPNTPVAVTCSEPLAAASVQVDRVLRFGTVSVAGNTVVWTPRDGFGSEEEFAFTVTNVGGERSGDVNVRIIVNTPPACRDGSYTVVVNTILRIPALPCEDPDEIMLANPTLSDPLHGINQATASGPVDYVPDQDYVGPDSFTYLFRDHYSREGSGTIYITVVPAGVPGGGGPAPVIVSDATPTPTPSRDTTAPTVRLKNAGKKQAVTIALTTNEAGAATLTAALDAKTARTLKLSRTIGTAKATLKAGTSKLKVKLSSKAAKKLKKLKRAKVTVTAVVTDAAGNTATKRLTVTLRK